MAIICRLLLGIDELEVGRHEMSCPRRITEVMTHRIQGLDVFSIHVIANGCRTGCHAYEHVHIRDCKEEDMLFVMCFHILISVYEVTA
jgi:hypothetical protein